MVKMSVLILIIVNNFVGIEQIINTMFNSQPRIPLGDYESLDYLPVNLCFRRISAVLDITSGDLPL